MADYTRLIEFKVKDTDLTRAVNKLSKTLESIDKTLKSVDKKLEHIAKKGFGLVTQEAVKAEKSINKVEKSVNRVGRALDKWSKGANAKGNALLQLEKFVSGGNAGLIKKVALFSALTKGVIDSGKAIRGLVAQSLALNTAWIGTTAAITGGILALDGIGRVTPKLFNLGKRVRQIDYDFRNLIKTASSRVNTVRKGGLEGLLSQFPEGSILGGSVRRAAGKAEWGEPFAGDKMGEAVGKAWTAQIKSAIGGLTLLNKQLNQATALQKNINAFSLGHARAVRDVAETQVKYNLELLKTKAVQAVVTADIWAGQKALQAMAATARGVRGFLGGMLGGLLKTDTGKGAGIIAITRSIEALTGKLGFLNSAWIKNANSVALWSARASEAITGINLAYKGLSGVLGAADWVGSAIKGFISFEKAAAQSIWRIQNQWQKFSGIMGAAMMFGFNPFGKGSAYDLHEMAMGGRVREEEKRYMQQGLTDEQLLEAELKWQKQLLQNRNVEAEDYTRIQAKILDYEKQISQVQRSRRIAATPGYGAMTPAQQARTLRRAGVSDARMTTAANAGGFLAFEKQVKKIQGDTKKIKVDTAKGLKLQTQAQMRSFAPGVTAYAPGTAGPARPPGSWQNAFSMGRGGGKKGMFGMSAGQRAGSMASSAMIGGGFPLLFGQGGLSALGGGLGGLAGGALGGGFGFALSIVGTAIASRISEGREFEKQITKVNAAIRATGSTSTFTSKSIKKLGKILGVSKDEAFKAAQTFAQFDAAMRTSLLIAFGDEATFNLVKGLKTNVDLIESIQQAESKIGREKADQLLQMLKVEGSLKVQKKLQEEIMKVTKEQQKAEKKTNFLDYINPFRGILEFGWVRGGGYREGGRIGGMTMKELKEARREKLESETGVDRGKGEKQLDTELNRAFDLELIKRIASVRDEIEKLTNPMYTLIETAETVGNAFEESFKGIIKGSMSAQQALANLFQRTADMFLDMAAKIIAKQIQMQIMGIALNMFPGFKPGGGGNEVNLDEVAKYARAAGGPVTGGQTYVVGEKGPELFTPTSSGHITPNHELGGSTNIVVNVDASGSDIEGDQEGGRQLGEMLAAAIQSELIKQQRPGGLLTK